MTELGYAIFGIGVGAAIAGVLIGMRSRGVDRRETAGAGASASLEARLDVQAAELRRLADGAGNRDAAERVLQEEVACARRALDELALRERERRERDRESWEVVRRLSTVLAGGASKGRAGENVLREHLAELPPGMLVRDFRVNGKVVEFGLLLPDGRRLAVDSKWPALAELEALEAAVDVVEREARAREVERAVTLRAREVAQYLDPALTAPVAVAAVPDAAYEVLRRAHADAFARGVVIVPYSTALPVLLFLYSVVARFGRGGDVGGCLAEVSAVLEAIENVFENKVVRATTMLANSADEVRAHLGKGRGSIARAGAVAPAEEGIGEASLRAVP